MVPTREAYEPNGAVCTQGTIERGEERDFSHGGSRGSASVWRRRGKRLGSTARGNGATGVLIGIEDVSSCNARRVECDRIEIRRFEYGVVVPDCGSGRCTTLSIRRETTSQDRWPDNVADGKRG